MKRSYEPHEITDTIKLPINARAECQLGARLLEALRVGFLQLLPLAAALIRRQCCQAQQVQNTNHKASNKRAGRMPTWGAFIGSFMVLQYNQYAGMRAGISKYDNQ